MHRLGVKPRVVGSVDRSVLRGGWNLSRSVKGDGSVVSRVRALRSQLCRRVAPRTNAQHATRHDFAWAIESAGRAGHVAYGVPLARSHCPCICSERYVKHESRSVGDAERPSLRSAGIRREPHPPVAALAATSTAAGTDRDGPRRQFVMVSKKRLQLSATDRPRICSETDVRRGFGVVSDARPARFCRGSRGSGQIKHRSTIDDVASAVSTAPATCMEKGPLDTATRPGISPTEPTTFCIASDWRVASVLAFAVRQTLGMEPGGRPCSQGAVSRHRHSRTTSIERVGAVPGA